MKPRKRRLSFGMDRLSGLYLWATFIIVFGIWSPSTFLTSATLHSVASTNAVSGILAIAILVPLAAGQYDLSAGATANLVGLIAVVLQVNSHWSLGPAVIVALAAGLVIGLVNGFLVVKLGVSSFIATLGVGSILAAFQVIVTSNNQPLPPASTAWNNITQTTILGFQSVVLFLLVIALIAWWFLDFTPPGRYIHAIGGNADAARLSGVRVDRWSWRTLVISGGLSGLAGVLYTSQSGPSLDFGATLLLPAFAAAFLGSTQLTPGRFNAWGTVIAIYALATGVQGLELVSGQQWLNDMFDGVALIVAVALAVNRQRGNTLRWPRRRTGGGVDAAPDGPPQVSDGVVEPEPVQMATLQEANP